MPPVTLLAACFQKTCDLLKSGAWDRREENPFQRMPPTVVDELLSRMWAECSERSVAHFRPLLTSDRLEHVALPHRSNSAKSAALLQMLSRGCRNLRTLSVRCVSHEVESIDNVESSLNEERALREVLRRSTRLELLHSGIAFEPDDLRNCGNLKTVRLHFGAVEVFLGGVTPDLWKGPAESQPLRSVEVLAMCRELYGCYPGRSSLLIPKIAMLLDNCPQLTSLGGFDSSVALKVLHHSDLRRCGAPRPFQLRRCFWVCDSNVDPSCYRERIRVAAQSCPLVEVLVIQVRHAGVLPHLKTLSHLTSLLIHFGRYDFEEELFSLLRHIGPQLRHLCLRKFCYRGSISLGSISSCPNLRTLQVDSCQVTADEDLDLTNLERLSVEKCERKSLLHVLSSCPRLKVLYLQKADNLDDGVLLSILRKNPFSDLGVAIITHSLLSEWGLRRFVGSASGLRSCCLHSQTVRQDVVVKCVRDLNPSVLCHPQDNLLQLKNEQFPFHFSTPCWL